MKRAAVYPDLNRRVPGKVEQETIQAMRYAKGDRRVAAEKLGISLPTLANRLYTIRNKAAAR